MEKYKTYIIIQLLTKFIYEKYLSILLHFPIFKVMLLRNEILFG